MSVKAVLVIDEREINVISFSFNFNQGADTRGKPSQRPVFVGLQVIIESRKDINLADWAMASNQTKQIELHIYPVTMGGRTRKLFFYDCHLVHWGNNFSSTGSEPMRETLQITAAGLKDYNSATEYSAYWRETYPKQDAEPIVLEENEPNLLEYHLEDLNNNKITKEEIDVQEEFYIVIKSEYCKGKSMSIDLEDSSKDYEYDGKYMKDDIITGIVINGDITKVKVKAIEEQKK